MEKKRIFRFSIIIFFSIVLISFFFFVFLSSIVDLKDDEKMMTKQLLIFNPYKNAMYHDIVETPIKEDFSIRNIDGNYELIHSFGSTEYVCTGNCVCESFSSSSRSTTAATKTLGKGLVYLVAAVSSYLAYDLAKKNFEEECKQSFSSSECSVIKAETDSCDEINEKNTEVKEEEEASTTTTKSEAVNKYKGKYFCRGHCINNPDLTERKYTKGWEEKKCDQMKVGTMIDMDIIPSGLIEAIAFSITPEDVFVDKKLKPTCLETSLYFPYGHLTGKKNRPVKLCTGEKKLGEVNCVKADKGFGMKDWDSSGAYTPPPTKPFKKPKNKYFPKTWKSKKNKRPY